MASARAAIVVTGGSRGIGAATVAALAARGPVCGLVSDAGLTGHIGDLADTPVDIIRRVIDVNLTGAVIRVAGGLSPQSAALLRSSSAR
jgi:NAD(P)-dependent dehydrogenase (short-subunit alcohol dehydrogenase family)